MESQHLLPTFFKKTKKLKTFKIWPFLFVEVVIHFHPEVSHETNGYFGPSTLSDTKFFVA